MNVSDAAKSDRFFYYGQLPLDEEIASDMMTGLLQGYRKPFYDRSNAGGLDRFQNAPFSISTQINMRHQIAEWAANRNTVVSDGSGGYPDRRVAVSQNSITAQPDNRGGVDVTVEYIQYSGPRAGQAGINVAR